MIRRLHITLLAAALMSQPKCMGMGSDREMIVKAAASVAIIGAIWYVSQPDSDETVIKKATKLIIDVGEKPSCDGDEIALQFFATRYLSGYLNVPSFEKVREKTISKRDTVFDMYTDIRVRISKDSDRRETLSECADDLVEAHDALIARLTYLDQYADYFKLYLANERGRALINQGPRGYNSERAQAFRNAMDEVEWLKNNASYPILRKKVTEDTYPQLAKIYGDINKRLEDDRRQREYAEARRIVVGAVAGTLVEVSAQTQQPQQQRTSVSSTQTTAQQQREQAAIEQAKKDSMVTAHQEEALRQAKARRANL